MTPVLCSYMWSLSVGDFTFPSPMIFATRQKAKRGHVPEDGIVTDLYPFEIYITAQCFRAVCYVLY
jgi:hypothetical protein